MLEGDLREALDRLGIGAGDAVIVHSSFRRFGAIGWSPVGMIEALLNHLGGHGTLAFPTMTWRTVNAANPRFFEADTPGHVGVLSEVFRKQFSTVRSLHPTHSVAAWGRNARHLVDEHHLDVTPCSVRSPYGKLAAMGGKALMLDVDLHYCTALHCAEERVAVPNRFFRNATEEYECVSRSGLSHQVVIRRHSRFERAFERFAFDFAAIGVLGRDARLGPLLTRLNLSGAIETIQRALELDDTALDPSDDVNESAGSVP